MIAARFNPRGAGGPAAGISLLVLLLGISCTTPEQRLQPDTLEERWEALSRTEEMEGLTYQGMFGVTRYRDDELEFAHTNRFVPGTTARTEFPAIPLLGLSVQMPVIGEGLCAGGEGGFLIGWWYDSVAARNTAGTRLVDVAGRLFTVDLFLGGYLSADVGDKIRIYAGAGPMMLLGYYRADYRETDPATSTTYDGSSSDAALGIGYYARAGLDLILDRSILWGVGVRQVRTELDFGNPMGEIDIDAIQFFMAWTIRF
jgi:hypothetical protein